MNLYEYQSCESCGKTKPEKDLSYDIENGFYVCNQCLIEINYKQENENRSTTNESYLQ